MDNPNVDYIYTNSHNGAMHASGDVATRLLESGFNINALRNNGVLRKEEWLQFDQTVVDIARKNLVGVGALMERGLRYDIPNGLGTTQLEWERQGDMTDADFSMSGVTEGELDRLVWDLVNMPLPIIHKDFRINIRALEASRKLGQTLDVAQATVAARKVAEKTEDLLYNGDGIVVGGSSIPGLLTHADRNTGSVTADWDTPATTGANKLTDVIAMIASAQADDMYGPYGMFIPNTAHINLMDDYKANSDKTQLQRLLEVKGLEFILPSKDVTAGAVVMVQLTNDVVDEVVGLQPTMVQWEVQGGMQVNFKVMSIMIPRIRSTKTLQSGVVHYS